MPCLRAPLLRRIETYRVADPRSLLLALALATTPVAAQEPAAARGEPAARISLTSSKELQGDGATALLKLRVDTTASVFAGAKVSASAGRVIAVGPIVAGEAEVAYQPPRVKKITRVRFRVTVRVDGKPVQESLFLDVHAPRADAAPEDPSSPSLPPLERDVALRVLVRPGSLVLDKDVHKARVFLDAPAGAQVEEIELFTNAGVVTDPRPVTLVGERDPSVAGAAASQRFDAEYSPPSTFFPQVALIAARARVNGALTWAFTSLPLWGQGTVVVRAQPHAKVTLDLAGRKFGPVSADGRGFARVPVQVPPGYSSAEYEGRALPIQMAPFTRVLAVPEEPAVPGDGSKSTRVRVFAVDEKGEPLPTPAEIMLLAEGGALGPLQTLAPGVFVADYQPPRRGEANAAVSAFIAGHESLKSRATWAFAAGRPASVDVRVEPRRYSPGAPPPRVTLRVLDATGEPTGAGTVELTTSLGELRRQRDESPGVHSFELFPPDAFAGAKSVELTALARVGEEVLARQSTSLELAPGPVARVIIDPPDEPVLADGEGALDIYVAFSDAWLNPATADAAIPHAERGRIGSLSATKVPGTYRLSYVPPLSYEAIALDTLEVRTAEGAVGAASVSLRPFRKRWLIGAHGGLFTNGLGLYAPALSFDLSYRFESQQAPWLRGLVIGAELTPFHRWSPGFLYGLEGHLTGVPVAVHGRYHLRFLDDYTVYAGAGAQGAVLSSVAIDRHVGWEIFLAGGGFLSAGLTKRVGPGAVVVETRLSVFAIEPQITLRSAVLGGGLLLVGYRMELF